MFIIYRFLNEYIPKYEETKGRGYISLISCNHDTTRARETLSIPELKVAYATLFTLPGVPFLYYGDEIGMKYLHIPTKEGGYTRTGTRTPMQWDKSVNKGFSSADKELLYLPVDEADDAPDVEEALDDKNSLLYVIRDIFALRKNGNDFDAGSDFAVICGEKDKPFVYTRGNAVCASNPADKKAVVTHECLKNKVIMYST